MWGAVRRKAGTAAVVASGFAAGSGDMIGYPLREIESGTDVEGAGGEAQDVNGGGAF
jgi:hypothetical protein